MFKSYFLRLLGFFLIVLTFTFCESDPETETPGGDFPTSFTVDIPSSISQSTSLKSVGGDDFSGKEIYQHLNNFIHIGESAAELIEDIMKGISTYGLNKPMEVTFTGDDDSREKKIVIVDNSDFEGTTWQHQLTMTDVQNESNDDGGIALQVFWNSNPIKGIAILKPKNLDNNTSSDIENSIFKIGYSEAGENGYDAEMTVEIAGFAQDLNDRFHMDNLKMFVGKTGDIVDVYGNSNHPDAYLFLENPKGFSWAFVASGYDDLNIGVAEVGLPPSLLDETKRSVLLDDYSIKNVFTEQITEWVFNEYPNADSATVALMVAQSLTDTQAPGFFNSDGFVQGGEAPNDNYTELIGNVESLVPNNPLDVSTLEIVFK